MTPCQGHVKICQGPQEILRTPWNLSHGLDQDLDKVIRKFKDLGICHMVLIRILTRSCQSLKVLGICHMVLIRILTRSWPSCKVLGRSNVKIVSFREIVKKCHFLEWPWKHEKSDFFRVTQKNTSFPVLKYKLCAPQHSFQNPSLNTQEKREKVDIRPFFCPRDRRWLLMKSVVLAFYSVFDKRATWGQGSKSALFRVCKVTAGDRQVTTWLRYSSGLTPWQLQVRCMLPEGIQKLSSWLTHVGTTIRLLTTSRLDLRHIVNRISARTSRVFDLAIGDDVTVSPDAGGPF
jgi:hypothetical protein